MVRYSSTLFQYIVINYVKGIYYNRYAKILRQSFDCYQGVRHQVIKNRPTDRLKLRLSSSFRCRLLVPQTDSILVEAVISINFLVRALAEKLT